MLTTYQQRERRDGIKLQGDFIPGTTPSATMICSGASEQARSRRKTKVIHLCHITNRTGLIVPVRRICDMAQARGIVTIVDGAHAF